VLFAFDRTRRAILLLGGDKSTDWNNWYGTAIAIADDLFDTHQGIVANTPDKPAKRRKGTKR
jgi:hypothetical protein